MKQYVMKPMVYNYIPKILTTGAHQTRPCLNPELSHVSVLIILSPPNTPLQLNYKVINTFLFKNICSLWKVTKGP